MISRTRLIITALLGCHLLLHPGVLTSQLRSTSPGQDSTAGAEAASGQKAPGGTNAQAAQPITPAQPASASALPTANADELPGQVVEQQIQNSSQQPEEETSNPRPATNVTLGRDEVLIIADEQEKDQDLYKVRGHVEIRFRNYILHADRAQYDSTTGLVTADGHVVFEGGVHNEHLVGSHATYDVSRDTGKFYDVTGSSGIRIKNKMMFLTSSTPFFFQGRVVEKLGPDRYRVSHGFVTSCQLPKPKWQFNASTALVEVGEEAKMYHSTLRIAGIPVFYFPYVEHPVDNLGRKSGFLIPVIGFSNSRGTILGDAFYWAINRNSDATIGAELFSSRGWAQHAEYRAIGYTYRFQTEYFGVIDSNGAPKTHQNQGGEELKVNGSADLPHGVRGVVSVDYLSSYLFRLAFGQNFVEAVNSEVRSGGFLSRSWDGNFGGLLISRYQNYQSTTHGDVIDIAHTPSFQLGGVERPLFRTPIMFAYDFAAGGLSRHEPGFETAAAVARVDARPRLSLPTFFRGWTFRPEIGVDETYYSQRLKPGGTTVGTAINDPINRNVLQTIMEIRPPSIRKIFDHKPFGYVLKHTIEPNLRYRYQTGVSNFNQILRFDERDILANTNEVEYGIVNRLYAKKTSSQAECFLHPKYLSGTTQPAKLSDEQRRQGFCDDRLGPAREVLTWELAQKYFFDPSFGGALVPGQRNVFDSTVDLTGIAFLTQSRRFSPIVSRVRMQDASSDLQWNFDYDLLFHQVNSSTIFAGHHFGNWYVNAGQTYLHIPGEVVLGTNGQKLAADTFNQYRFQVQYGNVARKGINGAATIGYDYHSQYLQYAGAQTTYNWDCCGVTFEYRRWSFPGVRNENFYRFALSLANFGTFGNIRRQDRLY